MRLLITASLLNSWQWYLNSPEPNLDEFKTALRRERGADNKAMQDGRAFETRVRLACGDYEPNEREIADLEATCPDGNELTDEYVSTVDEIAGIVSGGAWQVAVSKDVEVSGQDFLLYGRLDVLKGPWVFDIKFSHAFEIGKYRDSPQTKMYLSLVQEVIGMRYLVSTGKTVAEDYYLRENVEPIENDVRDFWNWLEGRKELLDLYVANWKAKY
jgi:hypothetical protein